jgi:hypothetical protein
MPLLCLPFVGITHLPTRRADVSDFERGRRDPDLLTLVSYGRLAKVYLDVLVDDELDLTEHASPCGPL